MLTEQTLSGDEIFRQGYWTEGGRLWCGGAGYLEDGKWMSEVVK
jgi:hypothetical protein